MITYETLLKATNEDRQAVKKYCKEFLEDAADSDLVKGGHRLVKPIIPHFHKLFNDISQYVCSNFSKSSEEHITSRLVDYFSIARFSEADLSLLNMLFSLHYEEGTVKMVFKENPRHLERKWGFDLLISIRVSMTRVTIVNDIIVQSKKLYPTGGVFLYASEYGDISASVEKFKHHS